MRERWRYLALGVVCTAGAGRHARPLDPERGAADVGARNSTVDVGPAVDRRLLHPGFHRSVLMGGSLADRFGRLNVLQTGLVVFGGGVRRRGLRGRSRGCPRALSGGDGVGGRVFFPASVSIVTDIFRDPTRASAAPWCLVGHERPRHRAGSRSRWPVALRVLVGLGVPRERPHRRRRAWWSAVWRSPSHATPIGRGSTRWGCCCRSWGPFSSLG